MNAALIQHLESLPKEHLEVHLAAYPWFTAARVVLAKKQNTTDAIQQTVPYVADRKWFKNYLDQKPETIATSQILTEKVVEEEFLVEEKSEVSKVLEVQEEILVEDIFETATEQTESALEKSEEFSTQTILEAIENKAEAEQQAEKMEEPKFEEIEEEELSVPENFSFSGWLTHFNNEEKSNKPSTKTKPPKDELDVLIKSNIPYEMLESKIEAETNYSKGLNDFIAQQKQHKKRIVPTADFDGKTQLPITETIAVLLEKQGRIKQAISVYEQLSLKFPMKSTYFAAHIRKLRDKI